MKRKLAQVDDQRTGLGAPTIMDRALAARHGAPYVRLAALAIDLDRAYGYDIDAEARPLGWEVFLLECYLLQSLDPREEATLALLEDTCLGVLEQAPESQALGSQVVFAVFDAVRRGALPAALETVFHRWRKRPKQLLSALDALWAERARAVPELAQACLAIPLSPPLSELTRQALADLEPPPDPDPPPDADAADAELDADGGEGDAGA